MVHTIQQLEKRLADEGLLLTSCGADAAVSGMANNSKKVKAGDLFVCKGFAFQPRYLAEAADAGAAVCLGEAEAAMASVPYIRVADVRRAQSVAARWFYDAPSENFTLVGVTGTKGKTTTVHDLHAIFDACCGQPTGLLSTVERYVGGAHLPSRLTTPESIDLQRLLASARDHGLPFVTMELSSQAFKLSRVYGERFCFGIFLNFGADHISANEHADMDEYFQCKMELLRTCRTAVLCRAAERFDEAYAIAAAHAQRVVTVGVERDDCDVAAFDVKKAKDGFSFSVRQQGKDEVGRYRLPQEGRFNVDNAAAAIAVGCLLGFSHRKMAAALEHLSIPGRMNRLEGGGVCVLVDYAHNVLSFAALFESLHKDYPDAPITVVTGSAGERDPERRIGVGCLCGKHADRVIFTADDPGYEHLGDICADMARAALSAGAGSVEIICDRASAVERAVREAPAGSIVVLAGKGHETTQRIGGIYEPYDSDAVVAQRALTLRR